MSMKILVKAGHHDRVNCYAQAVLEEPLAVDSQVHLEAPDGAVLPAQVVAGGKGLLFLIDKQEANTEVVYELKDGAAAVNGVSIQAGAEEATCDILIAGKKFTTLNYGSQWAKPFLWPVFNTADATVTRAYPMIENVPDEQKDHIHQKSFWTAWGEVNHVDFLGEAANHGSQVVTKVTVLEQGPLRVRIGLEIDWNNADGVRQLSEHRELTFYTVGAFRAVGVDVTLTAADGDVLFGDTKEGGFCSVRVPTSMIGDKGGVITLADGSVGEDECWGKRSSWCDYYGSVASGKSGICIMDNPANKTFPTYWHVRNYGLMAANPYGTSYFLNDRSLNGSVVLAKGGSSRFQYSVVFHDVPLAETNMPDIYHNYAHAPKCSIVK